MSALAFAGGALATEARAEYVQTPLTADDPVSAASGRLHKLESTWRRDCRKNPDAMHMALIGPPLPVRSEIPITYSVASFSCQSIRRAKFALLSGGRHNYRWSHALNARKVYTRNVDAEFNASPDTSAYIVGLKAIAKGHSGYYENVRFPVVKTPTVSSATI